MLEIEITQTNIIEGGVEVFARARRDGVQIGFGKDGTVDVERFKIYNPPILVPDDNGDIVQEWQEAGEEDGAFVTKSRTLREDSEEALLQTVEHLVNTVGKSGENIVVGKIGNTTSTFYPNADADAGATTLDGWTECAQFGNWNSAHDATTANAVYDNTTTLVTGFTTQSDGDFFFHKTFIYFDTSAISATDTISSATLSVYATTINNGWNDGYDYLSSVQVQGDSITSDTVLSAGDHQYVGDAIDNPTEGNDTGQRKDLTSISTVAYTDITLNSTGLGWIARSGEASPTGATNGITYFGLREGHDIEDQIVAGGGPNSTVIVYAADQAGTTNDPKLVVEHSAAASTSIASIAGIAQANIKSMAGVTEANTESVAGISNTS